MNSPEFKPLPSLGGSVADRLARSETARKAQETTRAAIEAEKRAEIARMAEDALRAQQRAEEGLLTDEQVEHWRKVLLGIIGPWARFMSRDDIQKVRDTMQKRFNPTN